MTERDDDNSCIITWSGENGSHSEVSRSMSKESSWPIHLLVATASTSTSVGQSWNASGSEATLAATGIAQTPSTGDFPMSARDRLLSENFISPNETIIAGAQLLPQVSKGNIGSIYNYSRINWFAPNDLAHINQTFTVPSPESIEPSNANSEDVFSNGVKVQNIQPSPHLTAAGHFEDSHLESYVDSRHVGLTSVNSEPFSQERIPSVASVTTRSEALMYYIDGDGARLSNPARCTQQNRRSIPLFGGQSNSPSGHDGLESLHSQSTCEYTHRQNWFTEESYIALTECFECTSVRDIFLSHRNTFPSLNELIEFARLYFDKFYNSFPLLHKASFLNSRDGCLLELAISAIGACYVGTFYARKCSESLHELVHTLLKIATGSDYNPSEFPGAFGLRRPGYPQRPTHLQARILNVLGMFHSGNPKFVRLAREDRAILVAACTESKILMSNHYDGWQAACGSEEEGERFLQQWLEGELRCRAGYFVWVRSL
jgi:hypothetical protein